jgi:transcriptional regulator with XRE-family HTH domain
MTPLEYIRKLIFKASQSAFGEIAGTTQASVSRWENGELEPGHSEMARIRAAANERGIDWDDRLFFELPTALELTEPSKTGGAT